MNTLLVASLAVWSLVPASAHAQCDPAGNGRPVKFISAERYAERMLSTAENEAAITAYGTLTRDEALPWTWWSEAKIRAHCAKKDQRGTMSVPVCVTYAQHQNAVSMLIDVASEMANVQSRIDEKRASCPVPATGTLAGAKARALWKCLGGVQLPPSFTLAMKFAGTNISSMTVTGNFLRGTPTFNLSAHVTGMGCGASAWVVAQNRPLDWPTSNSGDIASGDVTWAP